MLLPNWKPILNDLEKERAVLLIGPDFLPHQEESVAADFYAHLQEHLADEATHFLRAMACFYSTPPYRKWMRKRKQSVLQKFVCRRKVLGPMAELPFPLIISVNPDLSLPHFSANAS
ncbi:MAG: hypothetical protein IPL27_26560 [Lewinellaceae bacterium]|nr:hypothetical protein [Lewinellaceae bacterium]